MKSLNDIKPYDISYERMEFLGDAILDLVVVEYLYAQFPNANSGELSSMKSSIVNNKSLSLVAMYYDLDKFLLIGDEQ